MTSAVLQVFARTHGASQSNAPLLAPLAVVTAVFFLGPLFVLAGVSGFADPQMTERGATQYIRFLTDDLHLGILGRTLLIGLEVSIVTLVLGYPLAWLIVRSKPGLRSLLVLVTVLPLLTSVVVRTFAWIVILGREGIVNSLLTWVGIFDSPARLLYTHWGLVWALVQLQLPLMVLPIATVMARLDPELERASHALGAGAWRTFFKVTFPLTVPGVVAGTILTYSSSVTAFVTQSLIGGGHNLLMPLHLYQQAVTVNDWPFAAAIAIIFLVAVLAIVAAIAVVGRAVARPAYG